MKKVGEILEYIDDLLVKEQVLLRENNGIPNLLLLDAIMDLKDFILEIDTSRDHDTI